MGDIIYALPTLLSYNAKINLYLRTDPHVDFLKKLLTSQDYINNVEHRRNMDTDQPYIDLSGFVPIALKKPFQRLVETHLELVSKTYDFTTPWLKDIKPNHVADIVINVTRKYHDLKQINWEILKLFEDRSVFVGHKWEWKRFVNKYKLNIKFQETTNGFELAQIIKGSKFFIGNQSACFAIAEAMKHPRSLEVCKRLDNCQPSGKDGHTYLDQELIEKYLNL